MSTIEPLEKFKKAGICFSYSTFAAVPEIPRVADVLFALRLSEHEENYSFCVNNHEIYVANVHLVAAAVCFEVLFMRPYDEAKARKIIAKAIVDLCPEEARCLFESAFVDAKIAAGEGLPVARSADRETLRWACVCRKCRQFIEW